MTTAGPGGTASTDGGAVAVELAVSGMHCHSCVALLEEVLREQPGVEAATVVLEPGRAHVRFDPAVVGPERLRSVIAEAGYTAAPTG